MNPEKEQKETAEAGELLGSFTAQGWQSKITAESKIPSTLDMRLCQRCQKVFPAWTKDPKSEPLFCLSCCGQEREEMLAKVLSLRNALDKIHCITFLPVADSTEHSPCADYACGTAHTLASAALSIKMGWE